MLLAVRKDDLMAFISLNSLEVKPKVFDQKQRTFLIVSARVAVWAMVSKVSDTIVKIELYPVSRLERATTNCCE